MAEAIERSLVSVRTNLSLAEGDVALDDGSQQAVVVELLSIDQASFDRLVRAAKLTFDRRRTLCSRGDHSFLFSRQSTTSGLGSRWTFVGKGLAGTGVRREPIARIL